MNVKENLSAPVAGARSNSLDIGEAFAEGWDVFKQNLGLCILSALVAAIMSGVTCGIGAGAMVVGVNIVMLRLLRKDSDKPTVGSIFDGFRSFGSSFVTLFIFPALLSLVLFLVSTPLLLIALGGGLGLVVNIVMYAMLAFSMLLIADRKVGFTGVVEEMLKLVKDKRFYKFCIIYFLAMLLSFSGIIVCGIGILFTAPLGAMVMAAAYNQMADVESSPEAPVAE